MQRLILNLMCLLTACLFAPAQGMAATGCSSCCTISLPALSFGTYTSAQSSVVDSTTTLSLQCTQANVQYTVSLNNSAKNYKLTSGANNLTYQIFRDQVRKNRFQAMQVQTNASFSASFTLYGRIPANQDVPPGDYSDVLVMTVLP